MKNKMRIVSLLLSFALVLSLVPVLSPARAVLAGDLNNDGYVTSDDAIYLLRHVLVPSGFPVSQNCDYDGNGHVTSDDAIYLLRHVLVPDSFPLPGGGSPDTGPYSAQTVYQKLIAMKSELPEGTPWSNDNHYAAGYEVEIGGSTVIATMNGYGCVAFALQVSSAAFGTLPIREFKKGSFSYSDLRVGDILRDSSDSHTVLILEIYSDHVVIAEGNYNYSVHWGRTLSKSEVMASAYMWTRYPK